MTDDILVANYFDESVKDVLDDLFTNQIYPIVYAYIDGKEKFSFVPKLCTIGMNRFLNSRRGDIRTNAVKSVDDLKYGDVFYITCIDSSGKLKQFMINIKTYFIVFIRKIFTPMSNGLKLCL